MKVTNQPDGLYTIEADQGKTLTYETIELPATSLDLALLSGGGTLTLVPQTGQRTAPLKATMNVSRDYVSLIEKNAKALGSWDGTQAKAYVLIDGQKHYIQTEE